MTQYIVPVDADEVQDAIHTVLDQSVSEDVAQEVLDCFVQTEEITAPSGSTAEEVREITKKALVEQISKHKADIDDLISDAEE